MEEVPPYEEVVRPDALPPYQNNISITGRLLYKQEFLTPDKLASDRHWNRVEAELRGTTLLLFKASSTGSVAKYLRSYTLQAADVGLATDYKDRTDVFRARLEGEQLLFIAPGIEAAMAWTESLLTGIVISDPLESRKMPKYPALRKRGTKALRGNVVEGFSQRLWSELAWHTRQRREWLLETPSRTRKERWMEMMRTVDPSRPSEDIRQLESQAAVEGSEASSEESEALSKDTERNSVASVLEQSIRCTPALTEFGQWNSDYYIKSGRKVKINLRTTWTKSQTPTLATAESVRLG